ncbi:alkaline shock response membrane anchor protein AmaP [Coraliomargarita sinensis]|uniref:Alkaline shock response membrane anchor protein AmaP n=1 Tax=Coraliomargarita sinensis TaxID=2174842 RepID=A0A317ZH22_9BACT|nr:alkaline shock response membrane anchor protein AmaP [Coraliomargarita sinensis]PXA03258.1 alkaline shock response membrane anchor protein AmaP [Coraliomargarita sinensis]
MDWATLSETLEHLTQPTYLYSAAAVLVLAFFLILLVRRQPKNVTAYVTTNGQVMVSRSAIVELVQTSCEQIKEVSKPQVRMNAKGNKTHFEVRLKLASGAQLRSIEETLQSHLRKALTENLGIENLGRINIVATGFKSGRLEPSSSIAKKQPDPEPAEEPEEEIFDDPEEPKSGTSSSY